MDYRKFYQQETKTKLPNSFDVHHLDHNRDNNNIENLVAIPKDLHNDLHNSFNSLYIPSNKEELAPKGILSINGRGLNWFILNSFENYINVSEQVSNWIDYRDFLRGLMSNIHNIKY